MVALLSSRQEIAPGETGAGLRQWVLSESCVPRYHSQDFDG
jgi:hypothetical protein